MLVDGYQNEWETAIKNPEQCRRFVNFINLPDDQQHDETLVYQHERGQIRLPVLTPANPYPLPEPAAKPAAVFNGGGTAWADVCKLDIITPESGVCAKVDGVQIAVFRIQDSQVWAVVVPRFDPYSDGAAGHVVVQCVP